MEHDLVPPVVEHRRLHVVHQDRGGHPARRSERRLEAPEQDLLRLADGELQKAPARIAQHVDEAAQPTATALVLDVVPALQPVRLRLLARPGLEAGGPFHDRVAAQLATGEFDALVATVVAACRDLPEQCFPKPQPQNGQGRHERHSSRRRPWEHRRALDGLVDVCSNLRRPPATENEAVDRVNTMINSLIAENRKLRRQIEKLTAAAAGGGSKAIESGIAKIERRLQRATSTPGARRTGSARRGSGVATRPRKPVSPEVAEKRREALAKARAVRMAKRQASSNT